MTRGRERQGGDRQRPGRSWITSARGRASSRSGSAHKGMATGTSVGHLHVLRLGFVGVLFWSVLFGTQTLGAEAIGLAVVTSAYAALILATEAWRRAWGRFNTPLAILALVADGLFLTWVLYVSGGTLSPLRFLVYLHLIAVTLTYTYRAGIATAFMHSLFLYGVFTAQLSGAIDIPGITSASGIGESGMSVHQSWLFGTLVLWLITLAVAPFASVNERELRRRHADLEVLADMTDELENLRDPHALAQAMLDRVCSSFGFGRGVVLAVNDDELLLMARWGGGEIGSVSSRVDALVDRAWDEHEAILVARLDEGTDPTLFDLLPDGRNLLVAPMFADGQPLGALVVERGKRFEPLIQRRVISMVMQFASHGALAIRKAWLLQQVQALADTDALTDIANRRSFEKALDQDVARASRNGEELTLVMLDLDHFKSLNDRFGHQAGDEVLRKVGSVLRAACRESDTPSRFGGEEFAVLLPTCPKREAFAAAERLRELIAGIEAPVQITASAGVATYPVNASNANDMVQAADEALYQSKRMGRGRSTLSHRRILHAVESADSA